MLRAEDSSESEVDLNKNHLKMIGHANNETRS